MALATMALVSMLMGSTSGVGTSCVGAAPCTELTAPVVPTAHYAVRRSKGVIRMRGSRPTVDDVRRPGFNGRAWTGNPIVGNSLPAPCGNAAAYGADPSEEQVIYFPAWPHMIAIDPFEPVRTDKAGIDAVILRRAEDYRQKWLKDHGYTGGVRTFTNDAYRGKSAPKPASQIQPRGVIELSPEAPRFKSRIQVRSQPVREHRFVKVLTSGERLASAPAKSPE